MSPGWDRRPLLETQNPKSGAQKEAKKKTYGSNNDCSTVQ